MWHITGRLVVFDRIRASCREAKAQNAAANTCSQLEGAVRDCDYRPWEHCCLLDILVDRSNLGQFLLRKLCTQWSLRLT